ncbi:MAG: hypothetical protein IJ689_04620 [Alphaproteobacteria bacterium]|nr:hypothetical protein [Alphaproteobacteria bacterium]
MKNYILLLGVAGVALGSYCAYASNSATMTVTATIAHDVSLSVTQDINLGTITINPAATKYTDWEYTEGKYSLLSGDGIVSADDATIGIFTANIPNPSACEDTLLQECNGLSVTPEMYNIFGGNDNSNSCGASFSYSGTENIFNMYVGGCSIDEGKISSVTPGMHTSTITISYNSE